MKKPMLAEDVADFTQIRYPTYGSPKIDGVRALMPERIIMPRSLKRFPNLAMQRHFNGFADLLTGFDGELTVGPLNAPDMCRATSSAVATVEGAPVLTWHIFDLIDMTLPFGERVFELKRRFRLLGPVGKTIRVKLIEQRRLRSAGEAEAFEHEMLSRGYEGVVFKRPDGLYKDGRSTLKEQLFLRTKRFVDGEAVVLEVIELQRNQNEATINELGHQVRSHHKAGKVAGGTMGSLLCRMLNGPLTGAEFELGTGFDQATRDAIWAQRAKLPGRVVKLRYFPHGVKDKPRWPSFLSFREPFDM